MTSVADSNDSSLADGDEGKGTGKGKDKGSSSGGESSSGGTAASASTSTSSSTETETDLSMSRQLVALEGRVAELTEELRLQQARAGDKIAFQDFALGDIALFLPTPGRPGRVQPGRVYIAFTVGRVDDTHWFVSDESIKIFQQDLA